MIIFKNQNQCCDKLLLCFTFLRSAAGGNAEIHRLVYLRNIVRPVGRETETRQVLKLYNPNPKET